jgi:nucleotide-binding universal stress UspA family protein
MDSAELRKDEVVRQAVQRRILVPLEGSRFSEEILPFATGIATAIGAALTLLRVADEEREIHEARAYVEALARDLGAEGKVSLTGTDVTTAILEEASREPRALVAMTSHGRTGLLDALLGSVALGVVRNSGQPVLIYRPRGGSNGRLGRDVKIDRVVLPLDGSAFSESIIPAAAEMAAALKARLVLVHVVSVRVKVPPDIPTGDVLESSYVRSRAEWIERTCGVRPDWDVLHGDPGDAICRYLEGERDTILAMSSHSNNGFKRMLFGSVASECLRRSGSPMLVLQPKGTQKPELVATASTRR